ncbi:MAG: SCP2 sterol-binding domain-containing protein, partial [Lachnospiraceae bacterium]|nr:SCP2 sterol-binding domain-containing protein [Lachnospiraceae bacterium]
FKLAAKKLDPILAFTIGKLKVEGSFEKAMLLQKFL